MADIEKFVYYNNGSKKVLKPTDRIVVGSGGLAFEGETSDDFELQLTVTDPTDDRSINFPDEDGDVALLQGDTLPKALSFPVKNPSTTTALTKGQIVYISGHSGNKPEVSLAQSNSSSTMPAFGFVQSDIAAEAEGYVVYSGLFKGIDTNTNYNEGDTLYVSSTTAGGFVNSPPTGSNLIQNIGKIVKSDTSNGELLVGGAGRSNATPNLDEGKFFLGNASDQSVQSSYKLPISIGTSGKVLTSNGTDVTFETLDTGSFTYETKSADFSALPNYFYEVQTTSGNETIVTVPYQTNFSKGDRIKLFNKGDGSLRIRETISGTNIDPNDGTEGVYGSYKLINSKALVELIAISTTTWSYVIIPQLELDDSSLTTTGEVFAYNASEVAMKPLSYTFPSGTGSSGQFLSTNGTDALSFIDAPETRVPYEIITSNVTLDPTKHYMIPRGSGAVTITLLNSSTSNSNYQNAYFEVVNFSGNNVSLYISNVNYGSSPLDFYTNLYDSSGTELTPFSGSYTYTLSPRKKLLVNMTSSYNSGTQSYFLNYQLIEL